jgi:hypothetical protein
MTQQIDNKHNDSIVFPGVFPSPLIRIILSYHEAHGLHLKSIWEVTGILDYDGEGKNIRYTKDIIEWFYNHISDTNKGKFPYNLAEIYLYDIARYGEQSLLEWICEEFKSEIVKAVTCNEHFVIRNIIEDNKKSQVEYLCTKFKISENVILTDNYRHIITAHNNKNFEVLSWLIEYYKLSRYIVSGHPTVELVSLQEYIDDFWNKRKKTKRT